MTLLFIGLAALLIVALWLALPVEDSTGPRYDRTGLRRTTEGRERMRREYESRSGCDTECRKGPCDGGCC